MYNIRKNNLKFSKIITTLLLLVSFFAILLTGNEQKTAYSSETNYIRDYKKRIVFVIDASHSMNSNDDEKLINEIVKMFIDGVYSEKTEIGIVVYNDKIINSYPLTSVKDEQARTALKQNVDEIKRFGSTDIGLALRSGAEMLNQNSAENDKNVIILFSDGETDLTYSKTGRTLADSTKDENTAFEIAKNVNCPIYTVGLSGSGKINDSYLNNIANNTGGKAYSINNFTKLLNIFSDLFYDATGTSVVVQETSLNVDKSSKINVQIPSKYVAETNLIIQHNSSILNNFENGINPNSIPENVTASDSKNYFSLKILSPSSDNLDISYISKVNDNGKINIINFMKVVPILEFQGALSNRKVEATVKLLNLQTGEIVLDPSFYSETLAKVYMKNVKTGEAFEIVAEPKEDSFVAIIDNEKPDMYEFYAKVYSDNFNILSQVNGVVLTNNPPIKTNETTLELLKSNNSTEIDLSEYFDDLDGDNISFSISTENASTSSVSVENNMMKIIPKDFTLDRKLDEIKITATDERGKSADLSQFINIVPWWIFYKNYILGIGIVFVSMLTFYLIVTTKSKGETIATPEKPLNSRFNGARFEGYFLNTLSGKEIPVLNWNASYIDNKKSISLGELFEILDVTESLPESRKIFFDASVNGTVTFHHLTDCEITVQNRIVPPKKKVTLNFDDKIYIVFQDKVTEIEVRYRRVRGLVRG